MSVFGKNSGALLAKVNPNINDPKKEDPPVQAMNAKQVANALSLSGTEEPPKVGIKNIGIEDPAYSSNYELAGMNLEDLSKVPPAVLIQNYEASTGKKFSKEYPGMNKNPEQIARVMQMEKVGPFNPGAAFVRDKGGFMNMDEQDFTNFVNVEIKNKFGKTGLTEGEEPEGDLGFLASQGIFLKGSDMSNENIDQILYRIDRTDEERFGDKTFTGQGQYRGVRDIITRPLGDSPLGRFKTKDGTFQTTISGDSDATGKAMLERAKNTISNIDEFVRPYRRAYQFLYKDQYNREQPVIPR
tara:strand:+ start:242 stop:1138 length:897 start_codon:yes stop_codon:yes gene_type:complete